MSGAEYLIVGLGNPGSTYVNTRHNVGFAVLDGFARSLDVVLDREKWGAVYCQATVHGKKVILVEPQSFMNLSGRPVAAFADFFKIEPANILVLHDDLDMNPGRLKLVTTGGPGGHNGIRSLISCLGGSNFCRLKIGIGRPGQNGVHSLVPVEKYVLGQFSEDELRVIDKRMKVIFDGILTFVQDGPAKAMNIVNSVK